MNTILSNSTGNLLSKVMYRGIAILFSLLVLFSCDKKYGSICLPGNLTTTTSGKSIDSLIKANKYTALVLFCDNCGKAISDLYYWNDIVKENKHISPLIIIKSINPRLVETYLDIYHVNYPRAVYNFDTIRILNPHIKLNTVILIDSSYHIIHQTSAPENTSITWKYKHLYK